MSKLFATVTAADPGPAPGGAPPEAASHAVSPHPGAARTVVRDLVMNALLGVYAHERANAQRIRVSVEVVSPDGGPSGAEAAELVRAVVGQGHVTLAETLAERLAARCLADPRVHAATVRVEKLDIFPDAAAVGVEITRRRG